jgi:diaminopimelate decarboxylase
MEKKTPYFILNLKKVGENYKLLYDACSKYLNKFRIAYSVKTNSHKEIIKTLTEYGAGMEVASLKELRLSNENNFIIYNSPAKTIDEIKVALKKNAIINIDSFSDIDKLSKFNIKEKIRAGLRVSFESSKFGINYEKIKEAIKYADEKNIEIITLHFHSGTKISLKKYEEKIKRISLMLESLNMDLKYINLGGGIPDNFQMKSQNIKLEEYICLIKKYLDKFNSTIILEVGRFIVSDSMSLYSQVKAIKENFGIKYAILDAGINILSKITLADYKFTCVNKREGKKESYTLAGPLLFGNDILTKINASLIEGDIIRIDNVGAYCFNLSWDISYDKPKIFILN